MATENDRIVDNQAGSDTNSHHTWIENIADDLKKVNTEFPLSGGETDEDLDNALSDEGEKTSFFDDLESEFPLSGGEVDR